jgi:hypothetical protein
MFAMFREEDQNLSHRLQLCGIDELGKFLDITIEIAWVRSKDLPGKCDRKNIKNDHLADFQLVMKYFRNNFILQSHINAIIAPKPGA